MCGIIGYIGYRKASEVIFKGLRKLEYRGYDSAGIATVSGKGISAIKDIGRIDDIHAKRNFLQLEGNMGIGHTRWATHGGVTQKNAHPHTDSTGKIYIVHNGVIENFDSLRAALAKKGHKFVSETDTEVIAHLVEEEGKKEGDFGKAFANAVAKLSGSWSLVCMHQGEEAIYLSRNGPPLILGIGKDEMFCASDVPALLDYTKRVIYIEDGDLVRFTREGYEIKNKGKKVERAVHTVTWTAKMAEKEGFDHFMLKEIHEQGGKIREALAADASGAVALLKGQQNITVVACGTSFYAGLVFKQLLQSRLGVNCDVIIGSEFAYARTGNERVVVAISQSGETADTLSAVRLAKKSGAKILGITNVTDSSLWRESDATVNIAAGPEIAVVATKSFTSQVAVLSKIALTLSGEKQEISSLSDASEQIEQVLERAGELETLASRLAPHKDFFFIGRSLSFPSALEGALKLKEITYLHAEAYAAGELKHGPLSLLQKDVVVVALAPSGTSLPKTISNMSECRARDAQLVAFSDSDEAISKSALHFRMPRVAQLAIPIVYAVPLQLLAYYMAVKLEKDPDKPRNLAKSCTVE
ncbi:MAG: glutamine--fructose-6-phosphate transaminase (isomerizing) [Candidatus Micrarchaeota archaeon]|nr:glutamine--fructose-6-phosphate transaminase (isomerizing) [Candidatus Micrarchaeota archaeon]